MRKLEVRAVPAELVMVGGIDADKREITLPSGKKLLLFSLTGPREDLSRAQIHTIAESLQNTFRNEARTILIDLPDGVGLEVYEVE